MIPSANRKLRMHGTADFVKAVDVFMDAQKQLGGGVGAKSWQRARDENAKRLKLPLEVDGELTGQFLLIDSFPEHPSLKFSVGTMFLDRVVCRLDYDMDSTHGNGFGRGVPEVVKGPHWHSWELNRLTFKMNGRFLKLPLAEPFSRARTFDAVLRWYCSERGITIGDHGIAFPYPERLL